MRNEVFMILFCFLTIESVCGFILSEPYTDYQLRVRAETGGGYSNFSDLFPAVTDVKGNSRTSLTCIEDLLKILVLIRKIIIN